MNAGYPGTATPIACADYAATTERLLVKTPPLTRMKAFLNQRVLFPKRGMITLYGNRFVLTNWDNAGDVTVYSSEILVVGRGSEGEVKRVRVSSSPLMLRHVNGETLYLQINYCWITERTDNASWLTLLRGWLKASGEW